MKLSIAMIVKNEEKNLERTLISLKKLQNYIDIEIIIVDTGSTDNTVDIAKKYTDKIYFHKWNNDFADMRNISISYCNGEWILIVDADEVLYDVVELSKLIQKAELNNFNSATVNIIDFKENIENSIKNGELSIIARLFRKDTVTYKGIVHEQHSIKGTLFSTNIRFIHYGYDNNDYKLVEYKVKRNLELLLKLLQQEPENTYVLYQISATYHMHKDIPQALEYIERAYKISKIKNEKSLNVFKKYCTLLYQTRNYEKLEKISIEAIKESRNSLDFYLFLGEAQYNLGNYKRAIEAYKKYLFLYNKLYDKGIVLDITTCVSTRHVKDNIVYNMAMSYYNLNMKNEALDKLFEIKDESIVKAKISMFIKMIFDTRQWNKLKNIQKYIDKHNYEDILIFIERKLTLKDLENVDEKYLCQNLKDIVTFIKYFKKYDNINEEIEEKIKTIIKRNNSIYSVYIYYLLKKDSNNIEWMLKYGKDKVEGILCELCHRYYDLNEVLFKSLDMTKDFNTKNAFINLLIEKSLLLGKNLNDQDKKKIFLDYISEKYYTIIKTYNIDIITNNIWAIPAEDRFIIRLKETLSYKYEDTVKYIKAIRESLDLQKSYAEHVKLLSEEIEEPINKEIKAMIPQLINNIESLINSERYQEAYDSIEESLKLIKFDFDIMILKLQLLLKFHYSKEAIQCLKEIILYGNKDRVNKLLVEYF